MNDVSVVFEPHPGPQWDFARFDGRYALIGGAAGPGKTECLRFDPFRQIQVETARVRSGAIRESTGRSILFRRTMPELREIMDRCERDFHKLDSGVDWKSETKTYTFSCGYKYMVGQMEEEGDWSKYLGFEFTWVGFDELTTFTETQFEMLDTRLRSSDPVLSKMLYMRAGTNPIGLGLEWVRRRFVECAPPNTPVIRRIKTPIVRDGVTHYETVEHKQIFIPARLHDNPSIDQANYASTLMTKSSATRRALLDGDWYVVAGAFLGELWEQDIHVCKPFKIPRSWYRFRSCDYGHSSPSSVDWWAVDFDGNLTCFRSLYVRKHDAEMLAYRIKEIEIEMGEWDAVRGGSMLTGPLDEACWAKMGHIGPTIAQTMMDVGVHWEKSTKDRHGAADQMRRRLRQRSAHPTMKEKNGKPLYVIPGIRWFSTCKDAIRTLPSLPSDPDDMDVPDTKGEDHAYDSASYACMSRPLTPEKRNMDSDIDFFLRDELEQARRERAKRASGSKTGYPGGW